MITSLRYFFTVSFILANSLCFSQNCKDLGDWMDIIKKEYPSMQVGRAMPRSTIENLAINLYSDAYYVPLREKSFASLSQSARTKDWRKIQSCYTSENYNRDPYKAWVFQNIVYNYHIDFRSDAFSNNIKQRNQLRQELKNKLTTLNADNLDHNEVQNLKNELSTKYALLFPSELNVVTRAITKQEAKSAGNQLANDFETIKNLPLEYASIDKVLDFKSENAALLAKLSTAERQNLASQIDTKIEEILGVLMPKELNDLGKIKPTELIVSKINALLADFKHSYRRVTTFSKVQSTLKALQARKTEIVSNMTPVVETAMNNTKNQKEISELYQRFVVDLEPYSTSEKQLKNKFEQRRQFLMKEEARMTKENTLLEKQERLAYLATEGKEEGDMSLNTENFYYAEFFDYLYRGHTENLSIKRESEEFMMIYNAYINTFGKKCPSALPADKIQLMEWVCDEYLVTKEVLSGFELYRSCTRWIERGTGVFVKPELYAAKLTLEKPFEKSSLAYLKDMYTNPNAMGNSINQIHRLKRLQNDMELFFATNDCTSKAVGQFDKNLYHFAINKPLQRLKGMSVYEKMRIAGAPSGKQDIEKLINDIVQQQSQTWAANKYIPGTITNLRVFNGQDGKTTVAYKANYRFSNPFLGNDTGAVTIRLKEGLPDCIIFADFPNNCKKPSASLLMAYCNGKYSL